MDLKKILKIIPIVTSFDLSKIPLSQKKLDQMAKNQKLQSLGDEYMAFYQLPGGFQLKGSLDKNKNVSALWVTLHLWEDCFEDDFDSEEEFLEAQDAFDEVSKKIFEIVKKKLGKPALQGVSNDEEAFHYACWEYKKGSVLCLEQNDRDIEEGTEVNFTLSPLHKGKPKPTFIYSL